MGSTNDIVRATLAVINPAGTALLNEGGQASYRAKEGMATPATDAKNAADRQRKSAENLAADAELRRTNEEGTAAAGAVADAARKRQLSLASGAQGRRSTILTGPLGVVGEPTTAKKTILGA